MHRADRDLMNFRPMDAEKFAVRGRIPARAPHGLEPRMPLGCETVLLPDFTLEQVRLRMQECERGIAAAERLAASDGERVVGVEGQHGDQASA